MQNKMGKILSKFIGILLAVVLFSLFNLCYGGDVVLPENLKKQMLRLNEEIKKAVASEDIEAYKKIKNEYIQLIDRNPELKKAFENAISEKMLPLDKTISCDFRNADLKDVILGIIKQAGVGLVLNENMSETDKPSPNKIKITYVRKHVKAEKALQDILTQNGLDYFYNKKGNMLYIGFASKIEKLKDKEIKNE